MTRIISITATVIVLLMLACQSPQPKASAEVNQATGLNPEAQKPDSAQLVVNASMAFHHSQFLQSADIEFDFRKKHYHASRDHSTGAFVLSRSFTDTLESGQVQQVADYLSNERFYRTIDGQEQELSPKLSQAFTNSVNSVHYFSSLPFGLNDGAVNKHYLGQVNIAGKDYHKIKITFDQQGGGVDFEDVFMYWFDVTDYSLDYLAYEFHVNGGGIRFRKAVNQRRVGGVLFNDYINYKVDHTTLTVAETDQAFEAGRLEELSTILIDNIKVASIN